MLNKAISAALLATATLALCCLTACQKSKPATSTTSSSTSVTVKASNSSTTQTNSSQSTTKTSSRPTEQQEPATKPTASSYQKTSQSMTSTSKTSDSSKSSTSTDRSSSSSKTEASPTPEKNETALTLTPVSPGAAAGRWGNLSINEDGTVTNSHLTVVSNQDQGNGVLFLGISDALSGVGFYAHYYPAGVAIPFEHFEDPTDLSKDRLITGNGIAYTHLEEEHIDQLLLPNVTYRQ